jgi:predicted acyltransferase
MAAAGAIMALLAWGWNEVLPINKMLWSSSFVLAVGGYSLIMFALFYYIIDVRGWRRWTLFFRVIGLNSITIYLAQKIIDFKKIASFFLGGVADMCPEDWSKVILTGGYVLVCWLFLYFLYKKDTFLKV